jgi:excinuclease UvrABC nuclease subunit
MRVIDITKHEINRSSMDIITTGEITFLMFNRTDLKYLDLTSYTNISGIYLLIGERQIYIGQADNIRTRLNQHDKSTDKDWVTRIIFFTSKEGVVGKDMQNYIENKLIAYYKENTSRTVENGNVGQGINILLPNQFKSDNLIAKFHEILSLFNVDLMTIETDEAEVSVVNTQISHAVDLDGTVFDLTSGKQIEVYIKFIKHLYEKNPDFILTQIISGTPSFANVFGTEPAVSPSGQKRSKAINFGNQQIEIYTNLNLSSKVKIMLRLKQKYLERQQEEVYVSTD